MLFEKQKVAMHSARREPHVGGEGQVNEGDNKYHGPQEGSETNESNAVLLEITSMHAARTGRKQLITQNRYLFLFWGV